MKQKLRHLNKSVFMKRFCSYLNIPVVNLKHLPIFKFHFGILTLCAILSFFSCSDELYEKTTDKEKSNIIFHTSFKELEKNARFVSQLKKITQKIEIQESSKSAIEEMYNFTIDSTMVNEVTGADYTSHSFLIRREISESGKFENLVVVTDNEQNTSAYFVKYNKEDLSIEMLTTIENSTNSHSRMIECIIMTAMPCLCDNHMPGEQCTCPSQPYYAFSVSTCDDGGGVPGGGGGGGTAPTPPCQGRNCPDPIITVPVLEVEPIDNCDELKKLLKVPTYPIAAPNKTLPRSITHLRGRISGFNPATNEEGFNFRNDTQSYADPVPYEDTSSNSVKYSDDPNVFGGVHIHLGNLEPMFSHDDIPILRNFGAKYNYGGGGANYSIPVHMLISKNGTYAIKIDRWGVFNAMMINIYNNNDKKEKFREKIENKYSRFRDILQMPNGSSEDYEIAFLEFINIDYYLGISLYKVNENMTKWTKLTLGGTTNNRTVVTTDCN